MEPAEISLLLLRHLARDGCTETIRTYMTECPVLKESLGVVCNGSSPDVENFRKKLLNRSVNISLMDLLSEYGRAKSMIRDLVTKLLYDWKALSSFDFLSPHDSMATQLAHITKFLETKCKACHTDSKCIGTSDYPEMLKVRLEIPTMTAEQSELCIPSHDVAVQTSEPEEDQASDLPTIVNSLLEPPVIDKIVQIANKELNRSTQSAENPTGNDTETEIDKMLLDILHGISGVSSLPTNALNTGCSTMDLVSGPSGADPQLMALFQDAQSIIVNTPISGTLGRPEDSASKHRPCGSFLDLIETPFKNAFLSNPSTPVVKSNAIQPPAVEQSIEKLNCKSVELNFGALAALAGPSNVPSSASQVCSVPQIVPAQAAYTIPKQKSSNVPKYSIIRPPVESKMDLVKLRKKRDIRPKIPLGTLIESMHQNDSVQSPVVLSSPISNRSASKRKFSTPVKLSAERAMHPTVNFYCSTSSQDRLDRELMTSKPDKNVFASDVSFQIPRSSSIATPEKADVCLSNPVNTNDGLITSESCQNVPLGTINYNDLECSANLIQGAIPGPTVTRPPVIAEAIPEPNPAVVAKPCESVGTSVSALQVDTLALSTNAKTPDSGFSEQNTAQKDNGGSPQIVYNRLLASVRQTRPSNVFLHKKSFSTPRKKGHIRNLLFKTPPGARSDDTQNSSVMSLEDSIRSLKRKASQSPNSSQPVGSRSKKRLRWTVTVPEVNLSDVVETSTLHESKTSALSSSTSPTTSATANIIPTPPTFSATPTILPAPNSNPPAAASSMPTSAIIKIPSAVTPSVTPVALPTSISAPVKVSMEEVVSKLVFTPAQKNSKGRGRKSGKAIDKSAKVETTKDLKTKSASKVSEPEPPRSRTRNKHQKSSKSEQEQTSGGPSIVSPPSTNTTPSPATKPNRRKNARFDDHKAAEAAVIDAVPLGSRTVPLPKYRVTRGKSNLALVNQSTDANSSKSDMSAESILRPNTSHPSPSVIDNAPVGSQQKPSVPESHRNLPSDSSENQKHKSAESKEISSEARFTAEKSEERVLDSGVGAPSRTTTHAYKTRNAVRGKGKEDLQLKPSVAKLPQSTEVDVGVDTPSAIGLRSKTLDTSSSNDGDKDVDTGFGGIACMDIDTTRPLQVKANYSKQSDEIPVLRIEAAPVNALSSSAAWSPRDNDTNSCATFFAGKEPKAKSRSPRKVLQSQGKVPPRRILPKPVPADYPRVTFPPAAPNSSYVLSIPSVTPTKDADGHIPILPRPSFISPITTANVMVTTPPKLPKLSSDSSSDFNSSSVPKTPRLKNDSGEESCSMHARLFLGERSGPSGAGIPIYSSTPLKYDVPQTPGKSIAIKSVPVFAAEAENSPQSSLFDTPMKIDSPPKILVHSESSVQLQPSKAPSLTITPGVSFTPRKSPRKVASSPVIPPLKKKTPRKSNVPTKSVQNLPTKPAYEFKPTRKIPYKSPLTKKGAGKVNTSNTSLSIITVPPCNSSSASASPKVISAEKSTKGTTNKPTVTERSTVAVANSTTPVNNVQPVTKAVTPSSGFASLFTKAKSLKRLSEGAKRRVANVIDPPSTVNGNGRVEPLRAALPLKPLLSLQRHSQQQAHVTPHVSRSAPTTSVHPSDVGTETKVKTSRLTDVHFQFAVSGLDKKLTVSEHEGMMGLLQIGSVNSSQELEADFLSTIDLHKFLKTVHADD